MKKTISLLLHRLMIGFALSLLLVNNSVALAEAPFHSVTGSGKVAEEGFVFWETITAHQYADGTVRGRVVVHIDLRAFDLGHVALVGDVNCMQVEGNNAWIGAIITQSSNEEIVPVGVHFITLVRDLGGEGEDIMHGEFFPPEISCADKPAVPETVVRSGNFHVR